MTTDDDYDDRQGEGADGAANGNSASPGINVGLVSVISILLRMQCEFFGG